VKLPKDLNAPRDPERWKPMRERSYYKRSRRRNANVRGTQGASPAAVRQQIESAAQKQNAAANNEQIKKVMESKEIKAKIKKRKRKKKKK